MYKLTFEKRYYKDLRHIPKDQQKKIFDRIKQLAMDPRPHGCLKLSGYDNLYRIRVGNYRVIYTIEDDQLIILILEIADRKDAY